MTSTFNGRLEDYLIIPLHYSKLLTHVEVNNWHKIVIFVLYLCFSVFKTLPCCLQKE